MGQKIYDDTNGLWYEKKGDYFYPCLSLPDGSEHPVGRWGPDRLHYIRQNRKILYTSLLVSGELNAYLTSADRQAK